MRKVIILIVLAVAVYGFIQTQNVSIFEPSRRQQGSEHLTKNVPIFERSWKQQGSEHLLKQAFENGKSNFQVEGKGEVIKILSDDLKGRRHQRFIIRLNSGQTLLISHNIDLAPRINNLYIGDVVTFFGVYEWNHKGGVIHWTHHDPAGRHVGGWITHQGKKYQ